MDCDLVQWLFNFHLAVPPTLTSTLWHGGWYGNTAALFLVWARFLRARAQLLPQFLGACMYDAQEQLFKCAWARRQSMKQSCSHWSNELDSEVKRARVRAPGVKTS